jgi:hypothetical protein
VHHKLKFRNKLSAEMTEAALRIGSRSIVALILNAMLIAMSLDADRTIAEISSALHQLQTSSTMYL